MSVRDQHLAASNLDSYFAGRSAPGPMEVRVGARVALTRYHLLQLGLPATDPVWLRTGTVEKDEWLTISPEADEGARPRSARTASRS